MPLTGGLTFEFSDGRSPERARFALDDDSVVTLSEFLREAEELRLTIERQGGFGASLKFSWKHGEALSIAGTEPSADQRAIVLYRLRPFLLQNEPLNFHVVRGIIARSSESEALHGLLRKEKERFSGRLFQQQVQISIDSLILNSEAALGLWLNGYEYHRDKDKAIELVKRHDPTPVDSSRPIFIFLLQEKVLAIFNVARIAHRLLSDPANTDASTAA